MILVEQTRFHASLLELIGKSPDELQGSVPEPDRKIGRGKARRWLWREIVRDTDTGKEFPLYLCARFLEGKVWAVGIWSRDFLFVLESGSGDRHYFSAVPKGKRYRIEDVNWISKEDGKCLEIGVEP